MQFLRRWNGILSKLPKTTSECYLKDAGLLCIVGETYAASPQFLGLRPRAKEFFQLALDRAPENPNVLQRYGHYLVLHEQSFDEAFKMYEKGFKSCASPFMHDDMCIMDYLCLLYLRESLPSEKMEDSLEKALMYTEDSPQHVRICMASATYEMEYGCTDKAIAQLYKASEYEAEFGLLNIKVSWHWCVLV